MSDGGLYNLQFRVFYEKKTEPTNMNMDGGDDLLFEKYDELDPRFAQTIAATWS